MRKLTKRVLWGALILLLLATAMLTTCLHMEPLVGDMGNVVKVDLPDAPPGEVDRVLSSMARGNIAFNTPSEMEVGTAKPVVLLLSTTIDRAQLEAALNSPDNKRSAEIRISNRMSATLMGPGFDITPITSEMQAVARGETTEWKWEVTPRTSGDLRLHLTLSAILHVEGTDVPRTVRTFEAVIPVKVTWQHAASSFIGNNWQWLWATIVVPVAAFLWRRRKPKGEPTNSDAGSS